MNTQPTTSIETPVILLTTPLEYGRQKAKECGRKRISDEMAMRYAEPCYYWEVRDLLEKKSFDSMKNLFSFFYSLYLLANNKTAKSALCCGFVYSAEKREHSNSPYFFKSDADFQNLYKMDAININKMDAIIEYFTSQPNEPTLDELKAQYLAMPLDDLRRIKKEKYSNMDITTAMSNDEKAIVETIAIKFAELNQKIKQKRQAEKAAANQIEIIEATKEEVAHYINNGMFKNDAIEKVLASYNECLYSFGKDSFHGQQYQIGINYLKSLIEPQPTNQNKTMQPQPTQPQTANNKEIITEGVKALNTLMNPNFDELEPMVKSFAKKTIERELKEGKTSKQLQSEFETELLTCEPKDILQLMYAIELLKPLTVGQTIQGKNCRLIVKSIKVSQPVKKESALQTELKEKSKITISTLKSFIKKANNLFVLSLSAFDGMEDGVRFHKNPQLIPVTKDNAIGHRGVWCVGSSRDMLNYYETDTHFGIEVYNCCGCGVLLTNK